MQSKYIFPTVVAASVVIALLVFAAGGVFRQSGAVSATPAKTASAPPAKPSSRPSPAPEQPAPRPPGRYRIAGAPSRPAKPFDATAAQALPAALGRYKFRSGILIDGATRRVLWERDSRSAVPIASLTKLLTIYTAFEELERRPETDLRALVTVSLETTGASPVKMNFRAGEKVELQEVFLCAMLKSANDAALLIAEYFGNGRSSVFMAKMNEKARAIGMKSSNFVNPNGLPIYGRGNAAPRMNMASAADFALLIERLYDYPLILRYTSLRQIETKHGHLQNGNRLLGKVPGMEGLKTGYTQAAGHCLAFSCNRNGRRLFGIVTGFQRRQDCFSFVEKLLEWGYTLP